MAKVGWLTWTDTESAFIKWTWWTLAMAVPGWHHHKHHHW